MTHRFDLSLPLQEGCMMDLCENCPYKKEHNHDGGKFIAINGGVSIHKEEPNFGERSISYLDIVSHVELINVIEVIKSSWTWWEIYMCRPQCFRAFVNTIADMVEESFNEREILDERSD